MRNVDSYRDGVGAAIAIGKINAGAVLMSTDSSEGLFCPLST
jgi:hypothetical protein